MTNVFSIFEKVYGEISHINDIGLLGAMLGVIIDQWCADKNVSSDDAHEMLKNLLIAHEEINEYFGAMEPTKDR